jgi:hypothetical protein
LTEESDLLVSIAETIETYRMGELAVPTADHVGRWATQFTNADRVPFLRECNHVLRQTFITRQVVASFLINLLTNPRLVGSDPKAYWAQANVLQIQRAGQSQKEMVRLLGEGLEKQLGVKLSKCGTEKGDYIYLDDVLFTGGRVLTDLKAWIQTAAPGKATVHVIVIAMHTSGHYHVSKKLNDIVSGAKKEIGIHFWHLKELENQRNRRDISQVLWPAVVPDDPAVRGYVAAEQQYPLVLRNPGGASGLFSSEQGRQLLEREFLISGVKIRSLTRSPKDFIRPLGCSGFGAGFGAMIATYRNCPNNCPLAIWWGDPTATGGALHWYPLLARKTYSAAENLFQ